MKKNRTSTISKVVKLASNPIVRRIIVTVAPIVISRVISSFKSSKTSRKNVKNKAK